MPEKVSKLVADLSKVPNIIGGLGLSIAAAQKAFNADYLENLERLVALARSLLGGKDEAGTDVSAQVGEMKVFLQELLKAVGPPRYQFTETTLAVRLDLAQTMSTDVNVGLGVGYGGVAVNASLAVGYRYDYRAAAECRTVIQAIPADATMLQTLLDRAGKLSDKALELPARTEVDQRIIDQSGKVYEKVVGKLPEKIKDQAAGGAG